MRLWQAKEHAARLWPGVELRFVRGYRRPGETCLILRGEEVFGRGRGWLDAMRSAALKWAGEQQTGAIHAAGRDGLNDRNTVDSEAAPSAVPEAKP